MTTYNQWHVWHIKFVGKSIFTIVTMIFLALIDVCCYDTGKEIDLFLKPELIFVSARHFKALA